MSFTPAPHVTTPPADAIAVTVNGQVVDPQNEYAKDAKNTDYIVITTRKILSIAEEHELQELSITILEDLGNSSFLCHCPCSDLGPIRAKQFVRQVDVYRTVYKIPESLVSSTRHESPTVDVDDNNPITKSNVSKNDSVSTPTQEYCTVDILTHETVKDQEFEGLKEFIASTCGISVEDLESVPGHVRMTLEMEKLAEIAKDDRVRIIEEVQQPQLMSSYDSRPIIYGKTGNVRSSFTGKGQIVTVTDTGFDSGNIDDCHPAFTGKVHSLIPLARNALPKLSDKQKRDDPDGHGTHICGIISGRDFDTSHGLVGGIAPSAKLIVQSCYLSWQRKIHLPLNLETILVGPYEQGSRIFSNSWGVGADKGLQPDYANPAQVIDNFIRAHPDVLVCFSAGNDNYMKAVGKPTIGQHAGAKNVLTIGATGNQGSANAMYEKSSMGPSAQKRLKPDVVAPGVGIFAALSRGVVKYDGDAATAADMPNAKWKSLSGTSQATPLVAGCAAVLREALQAGGCSEPPGALLKAVIINGADKIPGIAENAQGHGRVNLQNSLAMLEPPPYFANDKFLPPSILGGTLVGGPLKQDEVYEFWLINNGTNDTTTHTHFKITMAYNDIGNKEIQNNLNLLVIDMGTKEVIPGNDKSLTDLDVQNNVEQIVLGYVPEHGLQVKVHAQKILALHEQDYVLAWSVFTPLEQSSS